ncbi:uncharacterized protein LOC141938559 [Strix uralensis]|uniref:uncharacterized protein LOC141938559 n=1 Tax=Strix uralensis TaxID=36305 RepID=UPI003DA353E7
MEPNLDKEEFFRPSYIASAEPLQRTGPVSVEDLKTDLSGDFSLVSSDSDTSQRNVLEPKGHIQVCLRIRPFTSLERENELQSCVSIEDSTSVILKPPQYSLSRLSEKTVGQKFTFSQVFAPETTQEEFFEGTMKQPVQDFLDGYNRLIFTYGVTNAGKTYTFQGTEDDIGILPRTMDMLFKSIQGRLYTAMDFKPHRCRDYIRLTRDQVKEETAIKNSILRLTKEVDHQDSTNSKAPVGCKDLEELLKGSEQSSTTAKNHVKFSLWVSFCEIYNECFYDLLIPMSNDKKRKTLRLAQDIKGCSYVKGLQWVQISDSKEAFRLLKLGLKHQSIGIGPGTYIDLEDVIDSLQNDVVDTKKQAEETYRYIVSLEDPQEAIGWLEKQLGKTSTELTQTKEKLTEKTNELIKIEEQLTQKTKDFEMQMIKSDEAAEQLKEATEKMNTQNKRIQELMDIAEQKDDAITRLQDLISCLEETIKDYDNTVTTIKRKLAEKNSNELIESSQFRDCEETLLKVGRKRCSENLCAKEKIIEDMRMTLEEQEQTHIKQDQVIETKLEETNRLVWELEAWKQRYRELDNQSNSDWQQKMSKTTEKNIDENEELIKLRKELKESETKYQTDKKNWLEEKMRLMSEVKEAESHHNREMRKFADDRERYVEQQAEIERLAAQLVEKDNNLQKWREERNKLIEALEVQLKTLASITIQKDKEIAELKEAAVNDSGKDEGTDTEELRKQLTEKDDFIKELKQGVNHKSLQSLAEVPLPEGQDKIDQSVNKEVCLLYL